MPEWLKYILEMLICSGIFVLLYKGLIERYASYRWSRAYLISGSMASVFIPLLRIPIWPPEVPVIYLQPEPDFIPKTAGVPAEAAATYDFSWIPTAIYTIVLTISLIFHIIGLVRIMRIRKTSRITRTGDYTLAENPKVHSPFSFMHTIYIGEGIEETERKIILDHERSHIRHGHSIERLMMSVLTAVAWFNPFIRMNARYLEEVQEWEADNDVLLEGCNIELYRNIIFKQLFGYYPEISCGLRNSLTKKRFKMMTNPSKGSAVRVAAALILAAGTVFVLGATARPSKVIMVDDSEITPNTEQTTFSDTIGSDVIHINHLQNITILQVPSKITEEYIETIKTTLPESIKNNQTITLEIPSDCPSEDYTLLENEIMNIYQTVREEYALEKYGKRLSELSESEYASVREEIPMRIASAQSVNPSIEADEKPEAESVKEDIVPYSLLDEKPKFGNGGYAEFHKWVFSQIKYPAEAVEKKLEGRVALMFTIGKDGKIRDVEVLRGADPILDAEAVRAVSASPAWTPGKVKGENVDVSFMFQIEFSLNKTGNQAEIIG